MAHLDAAFGQLRDFQESAPIVYRNNRRLLVTGYPSGIFYCIEARGVIISGVMDLRQDPEAIRRPLN